MKSSHLSSITYIQTKNVLHYAASAATARYLLFIYCLLAKSNQRPFALACWPYSSFLYLPAKCQQCGHNLISPFDWLWMDGFSTWLGGSLYSPIFRRSIHQVHLHRFPRLIGLRASSAPDASFQSCSIHPANKYEEASSHISSSPLRLNKWTFESFKYLHRRAIVGRLWIAITKKNMEI